MKRNEYEEIVVRYAQDIYRIAISMVHIKEDAEDILQNVYYKLLLCKKEFVSEEHIRRWLIRVVVNECKNHLGSVWVKKVDFLEHTDLSLLSSNKHPQDENDDVICAVMRLPAKLRIVIHLFYYEEYSTREIASILGILEPTVRSRLSRARKIMKTMIKNEGSQYDE